MQARDLEPEVWVVATHCCRRIGRQGALLVARALIQAAKDQQVGNIVGGLLHEDVVLPDSFLEPTPRAQDQRILLAYRRIRRPSVQQYAIESLGQRQGSRPLCDICLET